MIAYTSDLVWSANKAYSIDDDITPLLRNIQQQAITRNTALDITGLLMFWDGTFFQVLEGEEEAIRDVFKSIEKDPRHCHVRCLLDEEIPERIFSQWRMRCLNLNAQCSFDKSELIEMMQAYRNTFKPTRKSLMRVFHHTLPFNDLSI